MRPPHDPPRRRRTAPAAATTLTALVAAVLLLPGTALANADTSTSCDDPLVTYTRDGVDGDRAAVALTAQSIERGVAGWDHVTWSAAMGTTLTGVYATDAAGSVTVLDASATGTADGVVALTFCGSSGPVTASAVGPAEAVITPEPEPSESGSEGGSEGGSEEDTTAEAEDEATISIEFEPEAIIELDVATTEDDAEVADVDGDETTSPSNPPSGNEPTSEAETRPSNPPSGNEATSGGDAVVHTTATAGTDADAGTESEAAETEVLGVTIVAEADGSRTESSGAVDPSATDPTDPTDADGSADPIVTQAASSTEGPATPFLPNSVRMLLALAALLGTLAAVRAARSTEVSR